MYYYAMAPQNVSTNDFFKLFTNVTVISFAPVLHSWTADLCFDKFVNKNPKCKWRIRTENIKIHNNKYWDVQCARAWV